jgi:hypothetical protein
MSPDALSLFGLEHTVLLVTLTFPETRLLFYARYARYARRSLGSWLHALRGQPRPFEE